jgi:hypothetical protein
MITSCKGPISHRQYKLTGNRDLILLGDDHQKLGKPNAEIDISAYLMKSLEIQNLEKTRKPLKVLAELHNPENSEYTDSPNQELHKLSEYYSNPEYKHFVDNKLFININDFRIKYLDEYDEQINDIEEEYKNQHVKKKRRTQKNSNNNGKNNNKNNKTKKNKNQLLERLKQLNKNYHNKIMEEFKANKDILDLIEKNEEYKDTVEEFENDIFNPDLGIFEFHKEDFDSLHTLFAKVSGPLVEIRILEELKHLPDDYTCIVYVGDTHKKNLDKYFKTLGKEPINIV